MNVDKTAFRPMTEEETNRMKGEPVSKKNPSGLEVLIEEKETINHPDHYCRENAMECIDEMLLMFTKKEVMTFCKLNAWKYRYRAADKNGIEDLKKSDWYIKKYKELQATQTS